MNHYKYVFCILTYRNTEDIKECLSSIRGKVSDYKVVIVNSFYDNESEDNIKRTAFDNGCDFLSVPNKGYGSGNNKGINYIRESYNYDFIIVSNPDIVIKKFSQLEGINSPCVIAPIISTKTGKNQNPYWLVENYFTEKLIYEGMKTDTKIKYIAGIGLNKIVREIGLFLFNIFPISERRVYAAHGSFMILTKGVLERIGTLYDENIFLFAEEALLAHELKKAGIPVYLTKKVKILHKEDGSVGLAGINENKIARDSIIYYYEKIHKV